VVRKRGPGYAEFLKGLRGALGNVYVLRGTDDFLKREALRQLTRALVPPEARQFNCQSFLGAEAAWNDVEAACRSAPLFAEKRVVAVTGIEFLSEADVAAFIEYARRPSTSACLVAATTSAGEEGKRRGGASLNRLGSTRGEGVLSYVFASGDGADCQAWVRSWLKANGRQMEPALLAQVMEAYGNACYEVWNVLEKAIGLAGERTEVTYEHIAAVGGAVSVGSANAFRTAVIEGDRDGAHKHAAKCLEAGVQPTVLLWRLNRSFREALRFSDESHKSEIRWFERDIVEAIQRRFDRQGLCQAVALLYETEKGIKSGVLDARMGLELLINGLTT
jgi:DNA polymerase III delta subunit